MFNTPAFLASFRLITALVMVFFVTPLSGSGLTHPMVNSFPNDRTLSELRSALEDVRGATASRYNAVDSAGHPMDTAKIIADPAGGYLAVYHSAAGGSFEVHLADSRDLLHWTYRQSYGSHTHQPYLAAAPGGGFLLANETDRGGCNWIQLRYYADRAALLANRPARSFDVPHTQVPAGQWAEGTPSVISIALDPDIDHSRIEIGFHYWQNGDVDRQARGTLSDFREWTAERQPDVDSAILAYGIGGNIGDRDAAEFRGKSVALYEGQYQKGDFGSWRVFLWDGDRRAAYPLEVRTHAGSQAFANPTLGVLPAPGGGQAVVVTYYLPGEKAAPGEAGELIFYKKLAE